MSKALSKKREYPLQVVKELEQLETDLGGRQQLISLLALAPLTDDLRYILGLLAMPRSGGPQRTLASICAEGNILPGELLKHLGAAALHRGKTLALQQIGNGIAAVAGDLMRRAAPYEEPCHQCQGAGGRTPNPTPEVPNPQSEPCATCAGTGRLRYEPDLDRQKVAIEMANLLPKGGGLSIVNANVQTGGAGVGGGMGSLEKLQAITDKILYGTDAPEEPIDAEVTPVDDPTAESPTP